jgi:hypothetical protein
MRIDAAIAAVQAAIIENLQQSMRQLARHHSMDPRTKEPRKAGFGYGELYHHSVAASDPTCSRNEEGEVQETPQQAGEL